MDISLLKTFLELSRTRHFGVTAKNLFLTQSAVSARIRTLEETLGVKLLTRERNNIRLTAAGNKLLKYAEQIVSTWNRARLDTALEDENRTLFSVGGSYSLWGLGVQDWVHNAYGEHPHIALSLEVHNQEILVRKILDGSLDLAFTFETVEHADLYHRQFSEITLHLIASEANANTESCLQNSHYIMVDWGANFQTAHSRLFSQYTPPTLRMGNGHIALAFIQRFGGCAYLPLQAVEAKIAAGKLHLVDDSPVISRQISAIYHKDNARRDLIETLLPSETLA